MHKMIRALAKGGQAVPVVGLTSIEQSFVIAHWHAREHFLKTGNDAQLRKLEATLTDHGSKRAMVGSVELEFDLDVIEEGALPLDDRFEEIYDGEDAS